NEAAGSFDGISFDDLVADLDHEVVFIDMPRCYSEIWEELEKKMVPLDAVLDKDEDQIVSLLDVDLFTASSGKAEVERWLQEMERRLVDARILTKPQALKESA
ncbi:MAG: hypothetical protein AAF638_01185, partial [Pseudomonadota bacterium]